MDALIKSSSGKVNKFTILTVGLTPAERRKKALKALGICWAISLGTIPLPPIHFATVPGFFLFGFYLFWKKMRESVYTEATEVACPECGQPVAFPAQPYTPQWETVCPSCRYNLKVETT